MQLNLPVNSLYIPDYEIEKSRIIDFVENFEDLTIKNEMKSPLWGKKKYMIALQEVANRDRKLVEVQLDDIKEHFSAAKDKGFVERIQTNSARYISLLYKIMDEKKPVPSVNIGEDQQTSWDIIAEQRRWNFTQAHQMRVMQGLINKDSKDADSSLAIPAELDRTYQVVLVPGEFSKQKEVVPMREIKSAHIGALVTLKGIVTRASDVRPSMQVAVFACECCGYEIYMVINTKEFNPAIQCPSSKCKSNNINGQLVLQVKSSRFVSHQEVKLQEPSDQVPIGHVPRTIKILAKGEITRQCSPGDMVTITGIFMPQPYYGFRRPGLYQDTFVEAHQILKDKQNFKETFLSDERLGRVNDIRATCESDKRLFDRLAKSICPEIFGMEEVKKALLLLMVGGISKQMADGMKIRGNINVLLMGDPGVAKSQLMKHIANFSPRGIYTTGKGSSGVGLTAAVLKDPVTGELILEGGALVLADNGICCIDEFDKMDERDRTNIHEVMEQQTVSIAKAGITTSLNARTSVLAAANPIYGRYNPEKTPEENINLPKALLSRFDLIFLLLDKQDQTKDEALALHVCGVHKNLKAPGHDETDHQTIDADIMRAFIASAQQYNPTIPASLHNYIVAKYVEKRKLQKESGGVGGGDSKKVDHSYMYITPRMLLGIIRLSQSLAKLNWRSEVVQNDVDEALRLMDFSFRTLRAEEGTKTNQQKSRKVEREQDQATDIMRLVREVYSANNSVPISVNEILKRIQKQHKFQNIDKPKLKETLKYYAGLSVVYVNEDDEDVHFL